MMLDEREAARIQRETEKTIHDFLSPMEPFLMKIQSYLVWEKPRRSFVLFLIFHILFFYIKYSGQKIIFILSITALLIFVIHNWRRRIWPEIRVRPPSPEGADQWTPVHMGLLSVPEITHYLTSMWLTVDNWTQKWLYLRTHHPFLFCVLNVAAFSTLAIVGRYISGFLLLYILFASVSLWPSIYYHDMPQKLYLYCEPVFMKLDYYLTFRGKYPHDDKQDTRRDSQDDDDEFLPTDPAITAALARAITDSEDEEQTPPLSTQSSLHMDMDDTESVQDFLPSNVMPDVVDSAESKFQPGEFDKPIAEKRSKKRRPRAPLLADTFQPPEDVNQSNSMDVLSSMAAGIATDKFTDVLGQMFGNSAEETVNQKGGHDGQDDSQKDHRLERQSSQDSEIDQMISDDFDFLDEV